MAVAGDIAEAARAELPLTWDALQRSPRYGDALLQRKVDLVKESLFGSVIPVVSEDTYPLAVQDYAGKLVALELIDPGIDYWMNEAITETVRQPEEIATYESRVNALRMVREQLLIKTRGLEPTIAALLGRVLRIPRGVPKVSTIDEDFVTPSMFEFPRPYAPTERT